MKKLLMLAALACIPGTAFAQDYAATDSSETATNEFAGARIEARLGWETPTVSDGTGAVYKVDSALSYGGEIGYDAAVGSKVTVGPYATYEFSSVKVCDGADCLSEDANWSAGGRIGFAVSPKVALYGKLGYNSMKIKASSGGLTGTDTQGGIGGSLGLAAKFDKRFYGFVDFSYADYGDFFGINLQRRQAAAGVGVRF